MPEENEENEENTQNVRFLPFEVTPEDRKPITSDTELAKDLMKVVGKTAITKTIEVQLDKDGKKIGYRIKDAPNQFYEIINEDMTKSNLDPRDLRVIRGVGLQSNFTQSVNDSFAVDLSPTQKLLAASVVLFLNSSRSKGGWNAWLSKTDKTISQSSVEQIAQQLNEAKKRWWKFW